MKIIQELFYIIFALGIGALLAVIYILRSGGF